VEEVELEEEAGALADAHLASLEHSRTKTRDSTTNTFGNNNYCHTNGWDNHTSRNSTNCYPDMHHDVTATATDTKNGCDQHNVSLNKPEGVGSMMKRQII